MYRNIVALLFSSILIDTVPVVAQVGERLIDLPRVGTTIDRNERDYFGVFPSVSNFERAIFIRDSSGVYIANVWTLTHLGSYDLKKLRFARQTFLHFVERLIHLEGLREGTYKIGDQPPTDFLAGLGDQAVPTGADEKRDQLETPLFEEKLPFANFTSESEGDNRIQAGFGYGYSSYSLKLEELNSLLRKVEARYEGQGYQMPGRRISAELKGMSWWYFSFRFGRSIVLDLNAGSSSSEAATFKGASASVFYVMHPASFMGVRPFAGAGVGSFTFSLHQIVNYNARIGPVGTQGTYKVLSHVQYTGGATQTTLLLSAGLEIGTEAPYAGFGASCFASYLSASPIAISSTVDPTLSIDVSGFLIGIRGMIYF